MLSPDPQKAPVPNRASAPTPQLSAPQAPGDPKSISAADIALARALASERHPLIVALRQVLISQLLEVLNVQHHDLIQTSAALSERDVAGMSRGLSVKGSSTIPPSLRRALDLDFTVNIGPGYAPHHQQAALEQLFILAGTTAWGARGCTFPLDLHSKPESQTLRDLRENKLLTRFLLFCAVRLDDAPGLEEFIRTRFDLAPEEMQISRLFRREAIAEIVGERMQQAKRSGTEYLPEELEESGAGLMVCFEVQVSALDNLNFYAPFRMGTQNEEFHQIFLDRSDPASPNLSFANPREEVCGKIFALVANHARAIIDEPHTRDLVDLYIRTGPLAYPDRAYAPFRPDPVDSMPLSFAIAWPAHSSFYDGSVNFKYIDPQIGSNLKQVRRGLEKCFASGVVSPRVFSPSAVASAPQAQIESWGQVLLEHAWKIAESCFGVVRSGPNNNPVYTLRPPRDLDRFWTTCRLFRPLLAKDAANKNAANATADRLQQRLQRAISQLGGGAWPRRTLQTAAINILCQADAPNGRHWTGLRPSEP